MISLTNSFITPKGFFFYIIVILFISFNSQAQLAEKFKNPPIDARPRALWDWVNGNYNYPEIKNELETASKVGMGGFDIWDVGTINNPESKAQKGASFLSNASSDAIAYAIEEAKKQNLEMGLITSSSWNAGGDWIKEEDACKGLYQSDTVLTGGKTLSFKLPQPKLPKRSGAMMSENISLDFSRNYKYIHIEAQEKRSKRKMLLNAYVSPAGWLKWKAPAGEWKIKCLISANTGELLKVPSVNSIGLMLDHFSKKAQEKNLNYIFSKLTPRLGENLANTALKYLYVDSYEVSGSLWSDEFIESFSSLRGYSPLPFLPAILQDDYMSKDSVERFRYDVARTFSDMIINNHYLLGDKICRKYGIGYAAEAAGPGAPVHNCPFESLRSSGVISYPRGEFWVNNKNDTLPSGDYKLDMIKGVACAAHTYGRKYIEAESFTTVKMYQEDFNEMKKALDNAFIWGLNRVVFHTYQHNPSFAGKPGNNYPFGTVFGQFQPWWKAVKGFNDYIARCSYLLQEGNFVADVLFYYGDQAPNFVKETTLSRSIGYGYDYDVVNSEILTDSLDVKNGMLVLPNGQMYKMLVLPNNLSMPLAVLKKIQLLLDKGAIIVGNSPTKIPSLYNYQEQEKNLKQITENIWGTETKEKLTKIYGKGKVFINQTPIEVLKKIAPTRDFEVSNEFQKSIKYIHRKTKTGEDIYFVSNQSNEIQKLELKFRVWDKKAEVWNPITGEIINAKYSYQSDSTTTIPLFFEPLQSYFLVFKPSIENEASVKQVLYNGKQIFPGIGVSSIGSMPQGNYTEIYANNSKLTSTLISKQIDLSKNWEVRFPREIHEPSNILQVDSLYSWTQSEKNGIKYFSGEATYCKTFNLMEEDIKNIKNISFETDSINSIGELWLNGKHMGYMWNKPYSLNITNACRVGENNIVIAVSNGLNNRQVGDGIEKNNRPYTYSNITKGECAWCKPWNTVPLIPAGIMGKAYLNINKVIPEE